MKWSPCSRTDHARPAGVQTRVIERLAILLVRDQDGDRKRSARPSRLPRQMLWGRVGSGDGPPGIPSLGTLIP